MNQTMEEENDGVSDFCLISVINVTIATFNVFDKLVDGCLLIVIYR